MATRKSLLYLNPIQPYNLKSFYLDDGITLSYDLIDNITTVTTSASSPNVGIKYNKPIEIPANTNWEFVVNGAVLDYAHAYLWIINHKTKTIIAGLSYNTKYLPRDNISSISYIVGGFEKKTKITIGIKFDTPKVGDQFEINSMALIQRHSVAVGNFRISDMQKALVIQHKKPGNQTWDFIASFNPAKEAEIDDFESISESDEEA